MASVGIDFGTTNCVVSVFDGDKVDAIRIDEPPLEWGELGLDRLFPSVFGLDSNDQPLFGWQAKLLPQNQKIEATKRFLSVEEHAIVGDKSFTLDKIATLIFAQLRQAAANHSGLHFDKAVVTVPSNSRGLARKRTKICAGMGQIKVLALINEPTAAAMSATRNMDTEATTMVVDWGGGTLDVTILDTQEKVFVERASAGIQALGGVDFDSAMMQWLTQDIEEVERYSQAEKSLLRLEVERAKILLSDQDETTIRLPRGDATRITREQFEDATKHLLERAREPLERCLGDLRQADGPADVDSLILVGGTCLIPSVRNFISEFVQLPAETVDNPMTATSEGAAIASAILQDDLPDYDFKVSTQHALGVLAVSNHGDKPHFSTIIPRNQRLPAHGTDQYTPVIDHQEWLNLTVVEGDPEKAVNNEANVELQHWRVPIKAPRPISDILFDITYRYDTDGIIHINVDNALDHSSLFSAEVTSGQDKHHLVEVANSARSTVATGVLDKKTLEQTADDKIHDNLKKELSDDLVMARTKISPFIDPEEAANLLELCDRIVETNGHDTVLLQALYNFMDKYNYLI